MGRKKLISWQRILRDVCALRDHRPLRSSTPPTPAAIRPATGLGSTQHHVRLVVDRIMAGVDQIAADADQNLARQHRGPTPLASQFLAETDRNPTGNRPRSDRAQRLL